MPLSQKQRRFVSEYLKTSNASAAARAAGYSKKNANVVGPRLLAHVGIKDAIDKGSKVIEDKALVDAAYVLSSLKSVAERCMTAEQVMEFDSSNKTMTPKTVFDSKSGQLVGVYEFDSAGANRALELLGKHLKLFTERNELSDPDGVPVVIQFMPVNNAKTKDRPSPDDQGL